MPPRKDAASSGVRKRVLAGPSCVPIVNKTRSEGGNALIETQFRRFLMNAGERLQALPSGAFGMRRGKCAQDKRDESQTPVLGAMLALK